MRSKNILDVITRAAVFVMVVLLVVSIISDSREIKDLKAQIKKQDCEYQKLSAEKINGDTEYQKRIDALKGKIDSLNDDILDLQEDLKKVHTDNEHLRLQLDTVEVEQYTEPIVEAYEPAPVPVVDGIQIEKCEHGSVTEYTDNVCIEPGKTYAGHYELTAYIETGNACADGVYPQVGYTVACNDPALWHKWIYIDGIGERYVHDTGGMASNVIDVYVGDYDTAVQFGRQSADVYIVER